MLCCFEPAVQSCHSPYSPGIRGLAFEASILQADLHDVVEQLPLRSLDIRALDSKKLWQHFADGSAVSPRLPSCLCLQSYA